MWVYMDWQPGQGGKLIELKLYHARRNACAAHPQEQSGVAIDTRCLSIQFVSDTQPGRDCRHGLPTNRHGASLVSLAPDNCFVLVCQQPAGRFVIRGADVAMV